MRSPVRSAAAWLAVVSIATSWLASTPGVAGARPDGEPAARLLPDVASVVERCVREGTLTWSPSPPRAGTLFRVHLPATVAAQVTTARLAGEPLHFRVDGDSASAFAAVPVDSTRGLTLALLCTNGARMDVRVPARDGAYPLERLTVAPNFSAPPDSALQARQRREAARAAEVSRASHSTPRLFTEPFTVPRPSRITSGFGGGRTFNGTVTSRHMGTDYAGAVGAPVRAANRGVVRLVDGFYLGGNVIYLDHGEGLVTAYLHLSRHRVAVGDTVARGQVIGEVGATGRVTGPHLHFIVRYGNVTVDPESVVERSLP
jgi:murein DD-endopeptidase MepM/ murein hydrolase activator NlpD